MVNYEQKKLYNIGPDVLMFMPDAFLKTDQIFSTPEAIWENFGQF
jgi:hypothetical protein